MSRESQNDRAAKLAKIKVKSWTSFPCGVPS